MTAAVAVVPPDISAALDGGLAQSDSAGASNSARTCSGPRETDGSDARRQTPAQKSYVMTSMAGRGREGGGNREVSFRTRRSNESLGQMSHLARAAAAAAADQRAEGPRGCFTRRVTYLLLLPGTGSSVNCPGPPTCDAANELIRARATAAVILCMRENVSSYNSHALLGPGKPWKTNLLFRELMTIAYTEVAPWRTRCHLNRLFRDASADTAVAVIRIE